MEVFIGQVVDIYELSDGLRVTLWIADEQKKKTVSIIGLHEIEMGDVVQIHGGVGSNATILPEKMFPDGFETIIDHPHRVKTIEIAMPGTASGAAG